MVEHSTYPIDAYAHLRDLDGNIETFEQMIDRFKDLRDDETSLSLNALISEVKHIPGDMCDDAHPGLSDTVSHYDVDSTNTQFIE